MSGRTVTVFESSEVSCAAKILRDEMLKREDVYYGFLCSIESALEESSTCTNIHDLAECILERVMGGELDGSL